MVRMSPNLHWLEKWADEDGAAEITLGGTTFRMKVWREDES